MRTLFAVIATKGPAWDASKSRRSQQQWDEHALFMDRLAAEGFILLGGPLGDDEGDDVLLVINAASESEIRATLADDPWSESGILKLKSIQRWNIWLESASDQR
jgi:uncharacterized protein YciI